jgi:hypothetical protein
MVVSSRLPGVLSGPFYTGLGRPGRVKKHVFLDYSVVGTSSQPVSDVPITGSGFFWGEQCGHKSNAMSRSAEQLLAYTRVCVSVSSSALALSDPVAPVAASAVALPTMACEGDEWACVFLSPPNLSFLVLGDSVVTPDRL